MKPNIVVVMTEQHRGDTLSCDGHPVVMTPNIDELGGKGVRFSHAYSTCPVCVPARRSLITGQHPSTTGIFANYMAEFEGETLPSILTREGYQTRWFGRSMHQTPPRKRYGFEHMVINDHRILEDDYDAWVGRLPDEGIDTYLKMGVRHNDWTVHPWHLPEHYHHTNWTVDLARNFLETRDPTTPFFMVVSFRAAHPPLLPPQFYFDRYIRTGVPDPYIGEWAVEPPNGGIGLGVAPTKREKQRVLLSGEALRSTRAGYYGLVNHIDDQLRRLFWDLDVSDKKSGEETAVFFCSDHGELLGDHYLWAKSQPYEGSARIPFLLKLPPSLESDRGVVLDEPVSLEDIMPTCLDLAGAEIPQSVEGKSLLPLVSGSFESAASAHSAAQPGSKNGEDANEAWRKYIHIECSPSFQCLTDGKEKYIWFVEDGSERFFDLERDPGEINDRSGDSSYRSRIEWWRGMLVEELAGRREGFSDGKKLIPGRSYPNHHE